MNKSKDIKIFLKDYFSIDIHHIKKTLKKPALYANILFCIVFIYLIIKTLQKMPLTSIESIMIFIFIIVAIILQMYSAYKSGYHRFRYKEEYKESNKFRDDLI